MTKTEKFINEIPEMFAESKRIVLNLDQSEKQAELAALIWVNALVSTEVEFFDFKMEKPE